MSQEQRKKPTEPQRRQTQSDPIKYGDVFPVSGDIACQPIAPQDAAMMQTAENLALGNTQKRGVAATMQSAAMKNEAAGFVGHKKTSDATGDQGVMVTETDVPGRRIITESVAGQVVGQYTRPAPLAAPKDGLNPAGALAHDAVTIGEALEASVISSGDKSVDQSDAAAIEAAETRATGRNVIAPGGVAATAQSSANWNARAMRDEDKTKLGDILAEATTKLAADKAANREDAEGVIAAELRNNPDLVTRPGGVAETVTAAARLNESK